MGDGLLMGAWDTAERDAVVAALESDTFERPAGSAGSEIGAIDAQLDPVEALDSAVGQLRAHDRFDGYVALADAKVITEFVHRGILDRGADQRPSAHVGWAGRARDRFDVYLVPGTRGGRLLISVRDATRYARAIQRVLPQHVAEQAGDVVEVRVVWGVTALDPATLIRALVRVER